MALAMNPSRFVALGTLLIAALRLAGTSSTSLILIRIFSSLSKVCNSYFQVMLANKGVTLSQPNLI